MRVTTRVVRKEMNIMMKKTMTRNMIKKMRKPKKNQKSDIFNFILF